MDKEFLLSLQQLRHVLHEARDCLYANPQTINWERVQENLDFAKILLTKVMQEAKRDISTTVKDLPPPDWEGLFGGGYGGGWREK